MKHRDVRKIDLMHQLFGKCDGHRCGECSNFVSGRYHDTILRKCEVYGLTHSEATDWAKRWEACGMFNKEHKELTIIEQKSRKIIGLVERPEGFVLNGQIGFDDLESEVEDDI